MAKIDTDKYYYKRRSESTHHNWVTIRPDDAEHLHKMEMRLRNAYVDYDMILASMHEGLVVRTPFAQFMAIPVDSKTV